MTFKRLIATAALALAALTSPALAQPIRTDHVEAELHSARAAVAPGETFTIVLRQSIREHWHTYWRNPGDSGEPTELTWRNPAGWQAGPIQWPTPEALPFAILVNYGYSNEVLFPIAVTAPANARPGETVTLTADAYWLACEDVCIPEEGVVTLAVPIAAQGADDPQWAPRVAEAVANLPRPVEGVTARITRGTPARLTVSLPNADALRNPRFFPFDRDAMEASAAQTPRMGAGGLSFSLTQGVAENLGQVPLPGVVAYEAQVNGLWVRRGVEINAEIGEPLPDTADAAATISPDYALADLEGAAAAPAIQAPPLDPAALFAAIAFAFLGGLILNIMPCVLPVLSIKALQFAGGAHNGEARKHGLLFFAGVMVSFLALAGVLIALRSAGASVGWGFQLQAPWVTSGLALLFFVIGLNLLGLFEIGGSAQNVGAGLAARGGDVGAFFTGVLAVVAATPCTAPFMAGAIGAALTQPAAVTLAIFAALALGFALPLTALHFAPALRRLIPKPGPWMERAKNVLGFPMFGAAIWLIWVLAEQAGSMGVMALLAIAVALAFAIYVARWGRVWLAIGVVTLALTGAMTWRPLLGMERQAVLVSEPWSEARVEELRSEGRGVFVDFTAAWCITCKVNEQTALQTPRTAQAFADTGVAFLTADWTNRDEDIAAALAAHGRAGVPLYLYYPPDGEVQVLPQVLTEALVIETIGGQP